MFTAVMASSFTLTKLASKYTSSELLDLPILQRNDEIVYRPTLKRERVYSFISGTTGVVYYMWQSACSDSCRGNTPFEHDAAHDVAEKMFESASEFIIHSPPTAYCSTTGQLQHPDGSEYTLALDFATENVKNLATLLTDEVYQPSQPGPSIAQQFVMKAISSFLKGVPSMGEWVLATANPRDIDVPPEARQMIATVTLNLALKGVAV
jgi:hypothetical protein